jgi:hypothetical protein
VENLCFEEHECPSTHYSIIFEHGHTLDEFLDDSPGATREAAIAGLEEAKSSLAAFLKFRPPL